MSSHGALSAGGGPRRAGDARGTLAAMGIDADLLRRQRRADAIFTIGGGVLVALCLSALLTLVVFLIRDGSARLGWDFLTSPPSGTPERAGVKVAIVGSMLTMLVTAITAIPLGIAAGVYLEEYARKSWITSIIEINIANLAGVPSIIWGLMALGLFVYQLNTGRSILTAGLTLGLLVLPIVIVATRESIRAIPQGIREASFACGATRLQTVRYHIVPYSMPGILTGCIIAMSRAVGETAPLITIGALVFVTTLPPAPLSPRPWLIGSTSGIEVPQQQRSEPLASVAPSVQDGTVTLLVRAKPPMPVDGSAPGAPGAEERHELRVVAHGEGATTPDALRMQVNRVPNMSAFFTTSGKLVIEADLDFEFRIADDTAGLASAMQMDTGGGVHGPTDWLFAGFTVMPIQMYDWVSRPQKEFQLNAAAAGVVLIVLTLGMNVTAIVLRNRLRRSIQW